MQTTLKPAIEKLNLMNNWLNNGEKNKKNSSVE